MKGRSHRLQSSEPMDDWGDGSWTVDCVCGVTFDDGEEMVDCDECGVWVHTRCSRYVKGETSFACDKCKAKKLRGGGGGVGGGNENNEETEVAQLLVELPTKTVRMEPPPPVYPPGRRPFRLWTERPMEERVHVQGVAGGDPALFQGLSSVLTSELWKCTGYVPKKFNFQYREFPCWEESENPVDKGAGVLFSLSKEAVSCTPLLGLEREKVYSKEMGDWKGKKSRVLAGVFMQGCLKKERNRLDLGGKRRKEDSDGFKDKSGRKKARRGDKEADSKKGRFFCR